MTPTVCTPGWRFFSRFVLRSPGLPFSTLRALRCDASRAAALEAEAVDGRATFEREAADARSALITLAADPVVQEALFLSSPDFWRNNVGKYLRLAAQGRCNAEFRRIERRLFGYLQRLVAKNETTSAYGPLNYGRIGDADQQPAVRIDYADGPLVRRRQVFLTFWAVRALARAIAGDPELAPWLPLRLHPMTERVPGVGLRLHPSGTMVPLPHDLQQALAGADGRRGACELPGLAETDDAATRERRLRLLDALVGKGALVRAPFVASSCLHLLTPLRDEVAALPPLAARQRWLERIDEWQRWCDRMAVAPLAERLQLTAEADLRFTEQTGLPAHRGQGEMYADRTIYYEEALGNVERLSFSDKAHQGLAQRLQGALDLCASIGLHEWQQVRALGERCFRELSPEGRPLPMATFVQGVKARMAVLPDLEPAPALVRLRDEVRRLVAGGACRVADVSSASLSLQPGEGARYALPDLFVAADGEQALAEGRFEVFLGKVHHHLLLPSWLTTFIDDAPGLDAELRAVLESPGMSRLVALEVMRRNKGFYAFSGPRIAYGDEPAATVGVPVLPMRDVTVTLGDDAGLVLRAPGREAMQLYLTLADHLRYPPFAMLTGPWLAQIDVDLGLHTPRILVDGTVVQRERWHVDAAALREVARGSDPWTSFAAVARWADALGMPQQVYVKGAERKPLFVDFAIPQCHALLLGLAENAPTLRVEEMYPGPDALWLNHARGGFTCELRAAVLRLPRLPME